MTQNLSSKQYATSLIIILVLFAPVFLLRTFELNQSSAVIIYLIGFFAALIFTPIARLIDKKINPPAEKNTVDIKKYHHLKWGLFIAIIIIAAAMIYPVYTQAFGEKVGSASLIYMIGAFLGLLAAFITAEFPMLINMYRRITQKPEGQEKQ